MGEKGELFVVKSMSTTSLHRIQSEKGPSRTYSSSKAEPIWIHAGNGIIDVKIIIIAISRLQSMAVTWNFADGIRSKVTFVNMWQTSKFQMWTKSPMNNIQHTTDIWAYINWSYLFFTLKHYIFWRKSSFKNLLLRRVPLNSTCCKTWKLVGWQSL